MKVGVIEKGISIPCKSNNKYELALLNCNRLNIGESFKVMLSDGEKISVKSLQVALSRYGKLNSKRFTSREISCTELRIWRTK